MPQAFYTSTKGFNDFTVPPPHLPGLGCLSPIAGHMVNLPGLPPETTAKDFGICQRFTTLGQTNQTHTAGQTTPASRVCQRVEGVEPFITLTEAEVFDPVEPLNWIQITPSKSMASIKSLPPWECSHSRNHWARTGEV